MRVLKRSLLIFLLAISVMANTVTSCSLFCIEIDPEDVPIYPNAQDVKQEEPILDGVEIYQWSFNTTDDPEDVWQFYKEKLVDDWNGSDHSIPQSSEKDVMIKGCRFYYFKINSTSVSDTTYEITIEFSRQYYY
ncbi:MAG: hypothetical protein KF758_16570 [Anaerolineales bacterium]|nr:hypothetical protein [Anaerolineales bacterium]